MPNKYRIEKLLTIFFAIFISTACSIQSKENPTPSTNDLQNITMGEYLARINHWDYRKLGTTTNQLTDKVQEKHPEAIVWLEQNAEKNANFQYLLAMS